jgi:hypothetical protein
MVGGDAIYQQVVGVDYGFSGPQNAPMAIQVRMLWQRLGGLFNGAQERFGGVGITLAQLSGDVLKRIQCVSAPLNR